tara:strand:- start:534 stop:893 length:360 start_codon:yes stop_codon:yes gene_type:complete
MALKKHKNKKKCIIVRDGDFRTEKFVHADGTVEEIRVQEEVNFGVYIPGEGHLQRYLDMPPGTELPHLELSNVDVLNTRLKSKDFPKGTPTGLKRVHKSSSYTAPETEDKSSAPKKKAK